MKNGKLGLHHFRAFVYLLARDRSIEGLACLEPKNKQTTKKMLYNAIHCQRTRAALVRSIPSSYLAEPNKNGCIAVQQTVQRRGSEAQYIHAWARPRVI